MSLRDQLMKAGVVSRKQKQAAERELKRKRKQQQAQRASKRDLERQEREELERKHAEAIQAKLAQRRESRASQEAGARRLRANQIVEHHALRAAPGPQRFWHHTPGGVLLNRLDLPRKLATELRLGRLAVVWSESFGEPSYRVVTRDVALRLRSILPERVLFLNEQPPDPDDPAERLLEPQGEHQRG
jgi:uncharacterized protein YaiL (DUF2058 family)